MAMGLIFPIIILVIMITIVIIIVGVRGSLGTSADGEVHSEGGEDMIKTLYIYLVLFATLMMSIGGSVSVFMSVADLVAPTPYYQSYEDFQLYQLEGKGDFVDADGKQNVIKPTEAEIKAKYDTMIITERQREIGRAKNSLIKSFGWILIPLGIFIYFQRNLVKTKA